jgi:HSP20 family protein
MAIVRWQPFSMRWPNVWDWDEEDLVPGTVASDNLDVFETADEVVVKANVAGIPDEKVDITFEKGVLWIRAEEEEEKKEGRKYYRKATRSYSYKVAVPGDVDLKKDPDARIEKGVVTVTFKKAEEVKPKKIAVKKQA